MCPDAFYCDHFRVSWFGRGGYGRGGYGRGGLLRTSEGCVVRSKRFLAVKRRVSVVFLHGRGGMWGYWSIWCRLFVCRFVSGVLLWLSMDFGGAGFGKFLS